jgi:hypothetical protein
VCRYSNVYYNGEEVGHGRMNYKDTKLDLLTDFAALC